MKLKYENELLTSIDNKIVSSDTLIKLVCEQKAYVIGVLKFSNDKSFVVQFVNEGDEYKARLIISEDMLPLLNNVKFNIEIFNGEMKHTSNSIAVEFDLDKIKLDVKKSVSEEYKTLLERVIKLEEKCNAISKSKILDSVPITNRSYIQPGMVPVAINNRDFVAMYPFSDHVTSVNNQTAANGAVVIDASMIKYSDGSKDIEQSMIEHANAIISLKALIDELVENQKAIMHQLNDLDDKITRHINNGII